MRHLGELDSAEKASRFQDYMLTQGVSIHIDEEPGKWILWVREEDQIENAGNAFEEFLKNPDDSKYASSRKNAQSIRQKEAKRVKEIAQKQVDIRNRWRSPLLNAARVTLSLIVISVIVFLIMTFGDKGMVIQYLGFTNLELLDQLPPQEQTFLGILKAELSRGEIWRLVTPIFMHFGPLHILFNMMWIKQLGTQIEFKNGSLKMFFMVLIIAVVSNVAQSLIGKSLVFGGMSGVVFGLFGYVWMKSKFFPQEGFFIHPNNVVLMVVWFFLCMTPAIGQIANHAHGFGLGMGIILAFIPIFNSTGISPHK